MISDFYIVYITCISLSCIYIIRNYTLQKITYSNYFVRNFDIEDAMTHVHYAICHLQYLTVYLGVIAFSKECIFNVKIVKKTA